MDYDENDFQSQNLRLTGEGSTEFSPVIRPYALPKFDFDDSLQGHSRFDSLVETEVFLGIESQEDNHWIEDFSRGSSGIEFSPRAAESCSISRRNNAWSEATSSESVEMLLKSVGQEEMIPGKTINESAGHDEPGNLTKQMEPTLEQDNRTLPIMANIVDSGPTSPSDKFLGSFPQLNVDVGANAMQIEEAGQIHEGESSARTAGELCDLPTSAGSLLDNSKCTAVDVTGVNYSIDDFPVTHTEGFSATEMQADKTLTVSNLVTSTQNIITSIEEVSSREASSRLSNNRADGTHSGNNVGGVEHNVLSDKSLLRDQRLEVDAVESHNNDRENAVNAVSRVDSILERDVAESTSNNVDELSLMMLKGESDQHIAEGCEVNACSSIPAQASNEVMGFCNKESNEQYEEDPHHDLPVALAGDIRSKEHGHEVCSSSGGTFVGLEGKMDSNTQYSQISVVEKNENLLESGFQIGTDIPVSNSEAALLSVKDSTILHCQSAGSGINHVEDDPHSTLACHSPELLGRGHDAKNFKDLHNPSGICRMGLHSEAQVSSSTLENPMLVFDKTAVSQQTSVHNYDQNNSVFEKGEAEFLADAGNAECQGARSVVTDGILGSSSLGKCSTENEVTVNQLKSDSPKGHNAASGVPLDDGVLSPPRDVVINHEVIDSKFNEKLPLLEVRSLNSDKIEETETKMFTESGLLTLKDCSEDRNALHVIPRDGKDSSSGTEELICGTSNQPLLAVESFKVESHCEARAAVNKLSQEVSGESGGCPVACHSVRKDANAETVLPNNAEEETTKANYRGTLQNVSEQISNEGEMPTLPELSFPKDSGQEDKQTSLASGEVSCGQIAVPSSGGNASNAPEGPTSAACLPEADAKLSAPEGGIGCGESEKPDCGSPTVVCCIDPRQHEKQLQEGDQGSLDQNRAVCEVNGRTTEGVCSVSSDLKGNNPSKDDRSFTFEVTPLPESSEKEAGKSWQPFHTIQAGQILEGSDRPTVSQMDSRLEQETSHGNPQTSGPQILCGGSKSASRKTRRASGKAMGKGAAKKPNYRKEASPLKQSERGDKSCIVSPVLSATSQLVQSERMLHCVHAEHGGTKTSGTLTIGTSNLPDLNTSASAPVVFQQPFTDMQQVQLRAQILVYGSIILGAVPDEACMVSAFGASDGGRNTWENAWRASVERVHIQKALSTPETPLPSRPGLAGSQPSDLASKHGALQSKVISTSVGRASNKVTPSKVVNSMTSLSSPLWSTSTPFSDGLQPSTAMPRGAVLDYSRAFSPLHAFQTPPLRNFVGHASWPSQAPFPVPWIASQQTSPLDASARFSTLPITETVRLAPVRESSVPHSSGIKYVSSSPTAQRGSPESAFAGISTPTGIRGTVSPGQHSADLKPRKRKKIPTAEDLSQTFGPSQTQTESVLATGVTSHPVTSIVAISTSPTPACSVSKTDSYEITTVVSPSSTLVNVNNGNQDAEPSIVLSEETLNKVKEARLQAEEASVHAGAAVSHSQGVWAQLDKQKNSGLASEVEAALGSAAVAVAASASIAKAAAAAAKIASNAALQAKLMADEALVAFGNSSLSQSSAVSHSDGTSSASSIIIAAREAARRRVEAASAASKQAENFDALVKAAELVAEAVSQAGKVVALGDPIPLSQLVDAGPEGCWKLAQVSLNQVVKRHQLNVDSVEKVPCGFVGRSERPVEKIEPQTITHGKPLTLRDSFRDSRENNISLVDGFLGSVANSEEELGGQEGCKVSDLSKTIGVVPESELGSPATNVPIKYVKAAETLNDSSIKEGSLVEVFKDGVAYKAAWFLANVLSLEDGKACVCYTTLSSEDGLGKLKEWVALEGEQGKAPRVRVSRPLTATRVEGTRKRQRAAMGDSTWSVGDRVDAWIKECWWEGVIAETHKEDGTAFTVSFPAQGETSVISAWDLRPSLIWKDGEWIELFSSRENDHSSHEGDMHREKRPRLAGPAIEAIGKDKLSKNIDVVEPGKPEESRMLALSAKEKIFEVGKTSRDGIRPSRPKTVQGALRKEGAGVIFGVPKPGKKRKFMDVSKHYVAGLNNKTSQVSDSTKLAKILMPQGTGYRGASKVDFRGKREAESKLKPAKMQNSSTRSSTQKNKLLNSGASAPGGGSVTNDLTNTQDSDSHEENAARKQNLMTGYGSFTNTMGSGCPPDAPSKRASTFNSKSEGMSKRNLASSSGKLAKIEEDKVFTGNPSKSTSEVIEPRRSNRRIQPTSRLLEGLQSSLIISKIPAASHDRAHKGQNKTVSRGSNRG